MLLAVYMLFMGPKGIAKPKAGWPNAIHVAAWSVLVLTPLLTLVMVTTVKEPVAPSNLHQRFALSDYWEMILAQLKAHWADHRAGARTRSVDRVKNCTTAASC